ncbi:hypothetical protein A3A35_00465 [Candidatus Kaiserbacteria bacterium RIFCSPLOWO2_01_FULL_51_21]|uniref:SHS2 domain-containing protein n=1 Tax=Candidatus Kaiserbacteria bacterium RIFCSPLOWO2_01_FULL_51_21 TaxID=1798508 RepID=A0A1F6EDD0_9BACT|nr:MAG: hypothetical protein A3A35_00465 [Candidatus Kaiserbacteria bacterium RIFCSPLOWO2_01_FULL_51_21]
MRTGEKKSAWGLFTKFFPPPRLLKMSAIGVDISDRSVKYAKLTDRNGRHLLRSFGGRPIPKGVIERGTIQQADKLVEILCDLKKESGATLIRASLPEEHAYIFQTSIPEETPLEEIRTTLEFKLEEYVPIPAKDAIFDYEFLLPSPLVPRGQNDVTVSVYSKGIVAGYLDVFHKAKFTPLSFEVEAQAVARAVIKEHDASTYMIVDFGSSRTGIAIFARGALCFTSTVPIGGEPLSAAVRRYTDGTDLEVDRVKNEQGLRQKDDKDLTLALLGAITVLKDEINKHLIYWDTHKDERGDSMPPIDKIILCGGSSNLAGLSEYLATNLRLPVTIANVWINAFSFDDVIPELDRPHSLGFATTVGLALRRDT